MTSKAWDEAVKLALSTDDWKLEKTDKKSVPYNFFASYFTVTMCTVYTVYIDVLGQNWLGYFLTA
jgi:hypothetical protein